MYKRRRETRCSRLLMKPQRLFSLRNIMAPCNCRYWSRVTKRRMRAAAGVGAICLFLLFFLLQSEVPCQQDGCQSSERAGRAVQDKSSFVTSFPVRQWRNSSTRRILRWTGFFEDKSWEETDDRYFASCPESRCTMTNDRSLLLQSDAVLLHAGALLKFFRSFPLPHQRTPEQVWILHNVEPPTRTPLDLKRFNGLINWTAIHRLDSDVPVPYGGYIKYPSGDRYGQNQSVNFARHNIRFAAWMSSNCYDYNRRQLLIRQLKKLLGGDLDLYGACGGKRCPETICFDTISNYKFFFAMENANCRDYITEKFWSALSRRQVPVVLGGASSEDYRKVAPPNSFIHIGDFPNLEQLVAHLRKVGADEDAYNGYLAWTRHYDVYSELPARRRWWCDLCQALHDSTRPAQVYTDLHEWYNDDTCPQWTLMNQVRRVVDGLKIKLGVL
ncbi:alpha-(1,3)-fucosyltransferase C-like isoform X3 [Pomacea canaliculata]|uniref:alpha-(1,3)-fucosyltransferase C-like isoform X3 n=1 Tax=Pomacea canaliculata TaxID=400727 RepID=UPI000D736B28|nr:alpha-(1,3)-fucosyltransferase C-like isoform X3 [Pomacea canaliculata]